MLRQIRRFACALDSPSGPDDANEFLRQLHFSGARYVEVQVVPGERSAAIDSDSIYVIYEPPEPVVSEAEAVVAAVPEIAEPETAGNGEGDVPTILPTAEH